MYFDDKFESNLTVVNISHFLPLDERKNLKNKLNSHEIGLMFLEQRGVQASIFETIVVYINEHLTELFTCSLLAPVAYDTLKSTILLVAKRISGFFRKQDKQENPYPSMEMKIRNAEIIAPIPSNLTDEQFSIYMNTLQNTFKSLSDNEIPKIKKYDCFIVEYNAESTKMVVETVTQFGMERANEQRKAKE